jgi:SAM-dependent methyltransferase
VTDIRRLQLVDDLGRVNSDGGTWLRMASLEDRGMLARAVGPVLDVGCGPGRYVAALQTLGVEVLGIDVTPSMVETATLRGALVVAGSVFNPLPRMGEWRTALLLDGNSGLGADPVRLLRRLRGVLRPDGRVLADLVAGAPTGAHRLRLRHGYRLGPHFAWAPLHLDDLAAVAATAGVEVIDVWEGDHRWFCELATTPSAVAS